MAKSLIKKEFSLALPISTGSLERYIQTVSAIPILTAEQEQALGFRLQNEGDLDAAQQMVMSHLRFVVHIARGYNGYGLPLGDLIQEGNIGLMKAVKRFKPDLGVRLVSYAVHWIKAEIHEFILRNWRIAKVATTKAQRKLFFNLRSSKKRLGWLNSEEVNTIARELGVKPETVVEMESRLSGHDTAFDAGPENESDDSPAYSPSYFLEAPQADPAQIIEKGDLNQKNHDQLANALETLDDRSRDILAQRWLSENKTTLHKLADKYSISAERIRQLENNAIKKLKGLMEA